MLSTVQQRKVQVLQCHAIQHVLQCSLQFCATVRCRVENGFYKQRAWSSGSSSYLVAAEPSKEAYSAFKQPARPCKVDILSSMCLLWNPVRKLAYTSLSTSWYIVHYRPSAEPNPERKLTQLSSSRAVRSWYIVQYMPTVLQQPCLYLLSNSQAARLLIHCPVYHLPTVEPSKEANLACRLSAWYIVQYMLTVEPR